MSAAHTATAAKSAERLLLLFCHGTTYNKYCWKPILSHLNKSPLLQRIAWEPVAFDARFHGEHRDESVVPCVHFRDGIETSPRVDHPLRQWPQWAPGDILENIKKLRSEDEKLQRRTHVIGIGHSMGATSLMKAEVTQPGTLDGVIAFDAIFDNGTVTEEEATPVIDMLVGVTMAREWEWDSWDAVVEHVNTARHFRGWPQESKQMFLDHCVIPKENGCGFRRAMPTLVEASNYCHDFVLLDEHVFSKAKCQIAIEYADRTPFFRADSTRLIVDKLSDKLSMTDPIPKTTHSLIFEEPEQCAQRIVAALEKFPAVQSALATAKL